MFAALLGAGVGLAQAGMSMSAQADARNLSYLNLFEQKRRAREEEALAKATRSDAFGNKVVYRPGVGFVTETTPLTAAILNAQQKEQLSQFRDDAPRMRDAALRMDKRSKNANEVFNKQFNEYQYGRKKTEEEYVAEAIRNAVDARRDNGGKDTSAVNDISRLALRTGSAPSELAGILKAAKGASSDEETLAEAISRAKKEGKQQFFAETGAKNQTVFGELGNLRAIADQTQGTNLNWSNENAALSGRQDNALSNLIQTNMAGSNRIASAYGNASSMAGQAPDLSALSSALSKIQTGGKVSEEDLLAKLLAQQNKGGGYRTNFGPSSSPYKTNTGTF
jgi:hypothetical protein